jgi:hypothetical protein
LRRFLQETQKSKEELRQALDKESQGLATSAAALQAQLEVGISEAPPPRSKQLVMGVAAGSCPAPRVPEPVEARLQDLERQAAEVRRKLGEGAARRAKVDAMLAGGLPDAAKPAGVLQRQLAAVAAVQVIAPPLPMPERLVSFFEQMG